MKILIINSGSSSIKYQLFNMPQEEVICSGLVERIGLTNPEIHYKSKDHKIDRVCMITNHKEGLEKVVKLLLDEEAGVIKSTSEIVAVGHRVVHGGSEFSNTVVVDEKVKAKIKELFTLAPQHNPANYEGIVVAETIFPEAKQIAVFDTAFHQTMPVEAYKYAIPNKFLEEHNIRKFGFHGTSHKYVAEKAPVDGIKIDNLGENIKNDNEVTKDNFFSYSIKIADFYFNDTALIMLNRIKSQSVIKNPKIKKISDKKYRVYLGPFNHINSLQKSYNSINILEFDNIEIIKND